MRKLHFEDNVNVLNDMGSESIDLVYMDPPFNSQLNWKGKKSQAFTDIWKWDNNAENTLLSITKKACFLHDYDIVLKTLIGFNIMFEINHEDKKNNESNLRSYLTFLAYRLVEIKRVMKITGSLYLHCDPIASHYIKILLDRLFGKNCFRREIILQTQNPSGFKSQANNWIRHHDVIFYYVKNIDKFIFNKQFLPYDIEYIAHFNRRDEQGVYYARDFRDNEFRKVRLGKGKSIGDVWTDIKHIGRVTKEEKTRYPTQKPIDLLKRIILASSNKGDLILDPFVGSGTTIDASESLYRLWIAIDVGKGAIDTIMNRLAYHHGILPDKDYKLIGDRNQLKIPQIASPKQSTLF